MKMKVIVKDFKFYACFIFFFLGCLFTNYLQTENSCSEVEIKYENKKHYRAEKFKNPDLVILVMSAPKNLNKRQTIRQTWLKLVNDERNILHYFVIGSEGLSTDLRLHLSSEQSRYNDMLILPIKDAYNRLTYKVLQTFVWLNEQLTYGLKFRYVLKCDDDSFVRVDLFYKELKIVSKNINNYNFAALTNEHQTFNYQSSFIYNVTKRFKTKDVCVYWGYFKGNSKIFTWGKWKETNWIHCDNYIPYAQGGGYVISKDIVLYLAKNADNLMLYKSEDVSLATWLTPLSNILRIHDIRFDTQYKSRGCSRNHLISHKLSEDEMKIFYNNIKTINKPCNQETILMKSYYYNWTNKPSQCCFQYQN